MMIDLILTVCMISQPNVCKEEHLYFQSRGSLAQCMALSTPYVAKWAGDNPNWDVKSWTCGWPEDRKRSI